MDLEPNVGGEVLKVSEESERVVTVKHVSLVPEKEEKMMETEPTVIICSGFNCKQSTAPGRPKRRLRKVPSLDLRT